MESVIYIPHANTDHRNFIYRGNVDITTKMYLNMELKEHAEFERPIDIAMDPMYGMFGNNMAINPWWSDNSKRKLGIRAQKTIYSCARCIVKNRYGRPFTMENVKELVESRSKTVVIIEFKAMDMEREPDMLTEVKSWTNESMKILNIDPNRVSDEEKVLHLPMKTLGIEFKEGEGDDAEILRVLFRDCKVVERKGVNSVGLLVKRVDEYVDPDERKKK